MKSAMTREELQALSSEELVNLILQLQQANAAPQSGSETIPAAASLNGHAHPPPYGESPSPASAGDSGSVDQYRQALDDQRRRTALLTQIAISLNDLLDVETIVERVLRITASTLQMTNVGILLVNSDGRMELATSANDGVLRPVPPERARTVLEHGMAGWVLRHDQSVVSPDVARDKRWVPLAKDQETGSAIVTPIKQAGHIMGVMTMFHNKPHYFTSHDLLLQESLIAQLSVSLNAAHRRVNEIRRREQAFALLSTSQYFTSQRSFEDLAEMLQDKSVNVFSVDYGLLFMPNEKGHLTPIHLPVSLTREHDSTTLIAQATETAHSANQQQNIVTRTLSSGPARSYIALPLIHNGNAIGVIVLVRMAGHHVAFSANTWSMLTIFTGFIASTCANLQLVAQLRDYTETLEALIAQRTRQLQHSRDTLRIVFDNMRTGLVLLDSQEYLLAANSAFCHQIAGRDPRTLVGQEYALVWEQMVHDMHLQVEAEETLPTAMPAHTITIKRLLLTNQHAEKHRFEISREPIVDHSNTVVQYLEYWRNLTEPDTTEQTL